MRTGRPASSHYNVVIIGGGPAGCATALSLLEQGVGPVLVIEAGNYDRAKIGESLSPDIQRPLRGLGLWDDFVAAGHQPCPGNASSWGVDALGYNDFVLSPLGAGWHVDRIQFERFLANTADGRGAELCHPCRVVGIRRSVAGAAFTIEVAGAGGPRTVGADYLVDASGIRACVARKMGAKRTLSDQLLCVYGFIHPTRDKPISNQTLLEARDYGWWYRARLPDHRLIVALTCDADYVKSAGLRKWSRWLDHLAETEHVSSALAGARFDPVTLGCAPAPSCRTVPCAGDGWLAVGDAASSYDPIFARGIYKAFDNALQGAEAVLRYLDGDARAADSYQNQVDEEYFRYLEQRSLLYAQENRWPEASFWMNRTAAAHSMGPKY